MRWIDDLAPQQLLVEDERRVWTAAELSQWADAFCSAALVAGLTRGDRFAVLAKNRGEYVAAYLAAMRSGLVLVPLNWRLHAAELAWQLVDSGAKLVLADAEHIATLDAVATAGAITHWWRFAAAGDDVHSGAAHLWAEVEERLTETSAVDTSDLQSAFVQMYTSGTTGRPKGALLSPANYHSLVSSWLHEMPLGPEHRVLQVTPLFHVGALLMSLLALRSGATLVLHAMFDPDKALTALRTRAITHTLMVPAMMQWLLKDPSVEQQPLDGLAAVIYGASPMPVELLPRAMAFFSCDFYQGYGLTETSGVSTTLRPDDHRRALAASPDSAEARRLASAGQPIDCCEIRVVDPHDRPVAAGVVGEVVTRGDNVMAGYHGRDEETASAFRGGWFHTGDAGYLDDDGYVFLVDRIKDMVIVGGENVYPSEVERVLRAQQEVEEAAVIGVPHAIWGEVVLAYVVPSENARQPELGGQLIRACRGELARYKCPTRIELIDELPRNAAGKVMKEELRNAWWEGKRRSI